MTTYAKPRIVTTMAAAAAVKAVPKFEDQIDSNIGTSPAYEADE